MNTMIDSKSIPTYCITFLMISSAALVITGLPDQLIWIVITLILALDFIKRLYEHGYRLSRSEMKLFIPLLAILLIDKGNDFIHSLQLKDLLAIITGFLLISKTISLARNEGRIFWTAFFHACYFSYFLLVINFFVISKEGAKEIDQYLNYYCLMIIFHYFYVSNYKWWSALQILVAMYFYFLIFEPRFLVLCVVLFLFLFLFLDKYTSIAFKRRLLKLFWIILPPLLIVTAIWLELFTGFYVGVSTEFTGRGFIWFNFISLPITHHSILLGLPSSGDFLKSMTNTFTFNDNSFVEDFIGLILEGGNPHNGLVYIFYNSGLVGIVLFYTFMMITFRNKELIYRNWILILIIAAMFLLFGRSVYGEYLLGNMVLYALIIPLDLPHRTKIVLRHTKTDKVFHKPGLIVSHS